MPRARLADGVRRSEGSGGSGELCCAPQPCSPPAALRPACEHCALQVGTRRPEGANEFGLRQATAPCPLPTPASSRAGERAGTGGCSPRAQPARSHRKPPFQMAAAQTPPELPNSVSNLLPWCSDGKSRWLATKTGIAGGGGNPTNFSWKNQSLPTPHLRGRDPCPIQKTQIPRCHHLLFKQKPEELN